MPQNKKRVCIKQYGKVVCILLLLLLFLPMYGSASIDIATILEETVQRYTTQNPVSRLPGKAGVSSLFKKSLQFVQGNDLQVLDNSVQVVLANVNQQASCDLEKSDIVNILYYTDNYGDIANVVPFGIQNNRIYSRDVSFRNLIEQTIMADSTIHIPSVSDRNLSCMRLLQCSQKDTGSLTSITLNMQTWCEQTITQAYTKAMLTNRSVSLLTAGSFGENLFQNGSLDDSDYDLIVDISNIGRLLFAGYIPPVELVYYQLPVVGERQAGTSAANQQSTNRGSTIGNSQSQATNNPNTTTIGGVQVPIIGEQRGQADSQNSDIDQAFIQQTNQLPRSILPITANATNVIAPNICLIQDDPRIAIADQQQETISFDVYQELLHDYYDVLQEQLIINNLLAQTTGSISAPSYDPSDRGSVQTYTQQRQELEQQIQSMIESVFDVYATPQDTNIRSCVAQCDGLNTIEYAVCTAQCLCGEVASPALYANGYEILREDAFKVRFCQVPPSATPVTRGRRIYSIEEIFDEMRNIFVSLRDSGELFKYVRTKEFLDSGLKRTNFGSIFSFAIHVGVKGIQDHTPATQYKQELETVNQKLKQTLIHQPMSMASMPERNKYVVLANPSIAMAAMQTDGSVGDFTQRVEALTQFADTTQISLDTNLATLTQMQKAGILNDVIGGFFVANISFRGSVIDAFAQFNSTAENLRTKIQKAQ